MRRSTAILVLMLMPATACADVGPMVPGLRTIWIDYVFTVEDEYPDYAFFLIDSRDQEHVERLPVSPSNPVRVSGPGDKYQYVDAHIYAVRKSLLASFVNSPPIEWFFTNQGRGVQRLEMSSSSWLFFRETVPFTDNRERAEIVVRLEVGPDGGRIVKISENSGNPWVRWGWYSAGIFTMLGVTGLGVWFVRSRWRGPRTAPGSSHAPIDES